MPVFQVLWGRSAGETRGLSERPLWLGRSTGVYCPLQPALLLSLGRRELGPGKSQWCSLRIFNLKKGICFLLTSKEHIFIHCKCSVCPLTYSVFLYVLVVASFCYPLVSKSPKVDPGLIWGSVFSVLSSEEKKMEDFQKMQIKYQIIPAAQSLRKGALGLAVSEPLAFLRVNGHHVSRRGCGLVTSPRCLILCRSACQVAASWMERQGKELTWKGGKDLFRVVFLYK